MSLGVKRLMLEVYPGIISY